MAAADMPLSSPDPVYILMNDLLGDLGEIRRQGGIQLLEFRPQHLLDEALGSFNPNGLTVHPLIAESNTLPSGSLATLSTKGMRQGIRYRCGEFPNKQGLPSRFGFLIPVNWPFIPPNRMRASAVNPTEYAKAFEMFDIIM